MTNDDGERLPGTNLFKMRDDFGARVQRAIRALIDLNRRPKGSVHSRLQQYREHSETLLRGYAMLSDILDAANRENAQMLGVAGTSHRKRWTEDEDNALIEFATRDGSSMIQLALTLNRSPAAVSSRLTYLVGIHKVSQHVVGRLTGYLNGEPVRGFVDGVVTTLPPVEEAEAPAEEG